MPDVVVTQAGTVLEIQFNRPEKKNALTRAMYQAVQDAFTRADEDAGIRVALLSGAGDTFTSGNDIKDFQARAATQEPVHASPFLTALSSLTKPLVAAVNGPAIGVGTTMLAHADLVIAAQSARFVMPFTSLGLVPEAASSLLFPRLVGHQRASALLLLGEPIDAATAHDWGLVNRVVTDADLMDTAREYAARLAALPPEAVRLTKHLIKNGREVCPDASRRNWRCSASGCVRRKRPRRSRRSWRRGSQIFHGFREELARCAQGRSGEAIRSLVWEGRHLLRSAVISDIHIGAVFAGSGVMPRRAMEQQYIMF